MLSRPRITNTEPENTGKRCELEGGLWLQQRGVKIIEQNYHSRHGEIDIIGQQDNTLLFIEVRFRSHSSYGGAAESITPDKQQRIQRTAEQFLQKHPGYRKYNCRFDALLASPAEKKQGNTNGEFTFDWCQNAFEASY